MRITNCSGHARVDAVPALLEGERAARPLHGLRLLLLVRVVAGLAAEGAANLEADLCDDLARQLHGKVGLILVVAGPLLVRVVLRGFPNRLAGTE